MTLIDPTATLGALVNERPELARELERLGLDYCCGGAATLADACTCAAVDLQAATDALSSAVTGATAPVWSTIGPAALVDHLVDTHHRYLWEELPRLSALLAKIVAVHGERHPELTSIADCFEDVRDDLEPHLLKEELIVFPMVRELAVATSVPSFPLGPVGIRVSALLREHEIVGELLARLRRMTDHYQVPADGCASYVTCFAGLAELEADTHLHIHKENNLLFPMVARLESDLADAAR
jgi:regulator of cell morphogenesis and NO signaling